MLGFRLTDEQLESISYPRLELVAHVTTKTVQTGGLIGSCLVAPISASVRPDTRNWAEIQQRMAIYGKNGMFLGLALGPVVSWLSMRRYETEDEARDRCYRIRKSRKQVRVDQASVLGALGGYGLVAHGSFGSFANSLMFGTVVGMSSGIVIASVFNCFLPA